MAGKPRPPRNDCKDCGILLDPTNSVYMGIYRTPRCRECYRLKNNKQKKEWLTPEYTLRANLKNLYGITLEKYNELIELQQNGCAICRLPCESGQRLSVDHNHETNEIRGLLCKNCNLALGYLKENENIILNMLEYLKRTTWKRKVA